MKLDPQMQALMDAAEKDGTMIEYEVIEDTRARNKPTGGWDMGAVKKGTRFSSEMIQNGRVAMAPNKWILYSAVKVVLPPDDPPAETSPAPTKVTVETDDGSIYEAMDFVKVK